MAVIRLPVIVGTPVDHGVKLDVLGGQLRSGGVRGPGRVDDLHADVAAVDHSTARELYVVEGCDFLKEFDERRLTVILAAGG
jgi:hypothetical protein